MRSSIRLTSLLLSLAIPLCTAAQDTAQDFGQCVQGLQQQAREKGLSSYLVDEVLAGVQHVPRVIELDRRQPEFTQTFAQYLNRRVSETRLQKGREMLTEHRQLLDRLTRQYGVPSQYLVAFWGLETNYGGYLGNMSTLDSLATLACDPRRSRFFSAELLRALDLVEQVGIAPQQMRGSWAGAMGHTQFMPSTYQRYAVDGDGDGKADLWNSIPDALASAAHFLSELGWQRELRWGREVILPDQFDYSLAGRSNRRPLSAWRELGITRTDGGPLPALDLPAALIVPAGHTGPAFLVYRNFKVIMGWNRSEFYALSVGHLADRINGAGALHRPPSTEAPRLSIATIKQLQQRLNELGFDAGKPDGILGSGTRQAISRFQRSRKLVADGYPGPELFQSLGISLEATPAS